MKSKLTQKKQIKKLKRTKAIRLKYRIQKAIHQYNESPKRDVKVEEVSK